MPPVIIAILALFIIGVGSSFRIHQQDIIHSIGEDLQNVSKSMRQEQNEKAQLLGELGRQLQGIESFRRAVQERDEKGMHAVAGPLFRQWRQKYGLSHVHVYDKSEKSMMRLDASPDRNDDISHQLLKAARKDHAIHSGIEVSTTGLLMLTSVVPVEGAQVGAYIEISADLTRIINKEHIPVLGSKYLLTIYRKGLPNKVARHLEEEARRGTVAAYPALFAIAGTAGKVLPGQETPIIAAREHAHFHVRCEGGTFLWQRCIGFVPIDGGEGQEIGDMIVIRDVSRKMHALIHELRVHATVAALMLIILVVFLGMLLGRMERRMREISDRVQEGQSQLQQSNEALQASEQRTRLVMDSAAEGIYGIDGEGICMFANAATARMLGYDDPEMLIGRNMHALIHHSRADGQPYPESECTIRSVIEPGTRAHVDDECFWRKDGTPLPVEYWARPMLVEGNARGSVVTFIDISERIRQEAELHKLSKAIDQAGESVVITDRKGVIEYVNPAFERLTGYMADEVIGKTPAILKSSAQDPAYYEQMWQTISRGEVWNGSMIDRRKDGSFYPVLMSVAPIRDRSGEITHFVGLQQDITERQELEQQLIQAQKMEAIGTLVGGIAHDFNNMLSGITGNAYMVRQGSEDPMVQERMEIIEKLGFRGAEMIRQLLVFARKDLVSMKQIPLHTFINEAMKLSATIVPENISLVVDACDDALPVKGDATQLQQMLMNLIANARDAVEPAARPEIRIIVERLEANDPRLEGKVGMAGQGAAHIAVCDNGMGMPESIREQVFEPFFTTKDVDKGTGLGLSMVFGVVQTHGGWIELESREGEGTTVHIYLPLREDAESREQRSGHGVVRGAGEVVLVVDDETGLRETMVDVLHSLGYRTLEAEDGRAGVAMLEQHADQVAVAMLDVVMPEMGGIEAAGLMRVRRPDLPILMVTGYDRQQLLDEDALPEGAVIMAKPVKVEELSRQLQRLLQRR